MIVPSPTRKTLRSSCAAFGAAVLLAGCSMAGMPQFAPRSATTVASVAPTDAPVPLTRLTTTDGGGADVLPLAFAPEPARPSGNAGVDTLIAKYASLYDIPPSLLHRVVRSESGYNPGARNGPYYGLMQIRPETARTMGYSGSAGGLLDAETNLKYGAKYLRGAYMVAGFNAERAISLYRSGYYYHAKRAGMLEATGLR